MDTTPKRQRADENPQQPPGPRKIRFLRRVPNGPYIYNPVRSLFQEGPEPEMPQS
jgi:hypothetical protein